MFQKLQNNKDAHCLLDGLLYLPKVENGLHDMGKFGHNHIQINKHLS